MTPDPAGGLGEHVTNMTDVFTFPSGATSPRWRSIRNRRHRVGALHCGLRLRPPDQSPADRKARSRSGGPGGIGQAMVERTVYDLLASGQLLSAADGPRPAARRRSSAVRYAGAVERPARPSLRLPSADAVTVTCAGLSFSRGSTNTGSASSASAASRRTAEALAAVQHFVHQHPIRLDLRWPATFSVRTSRIDCVWRGASVSIGGLATEAGWWSDSASSPCTWSQPNNRTCALSGVSPLVGQRDDGGGLARRNQRHGRLDVNRCRVRKGHRQEERKKSPGVFLSCCVSDRGR